MPVTLRHQLATSFSRLHECYPEGSVGTHKKIGSSPPFQVGQQLWGGLRRGPGATRQRRYSMTDGQIDPLDKSGVQPSREAHPLQGEREICLCPETHHVRDPQQLAPAVAFLHLAVDQARLYLPLAHFPPSTIQREPLSKMGRESIKVQV